MSAVAKRYARALFDVVNEHGTLEATEQELVQINGIIRENTEFENLLTHPKISVDEKKNLINQLFQGKVSDITLNFVNLLIERGREHELGQVTATFTELSNETRGLADAIVTTAKPLTEEEIKQLADSFGQKLNKTLRVTTVVDPTILGGVVVRIGNRLYDGSIKGKLDRFTQQIKQAQV
ncbi:F0F1 ATP synthase subunit delta [Aneurinibacillus sp. Ricciae_BoGa-3]|uniref:F0F1 ATP synthase subunit delta n=1 Tax=Aneurinibacillus sp. Ricciae_BoGa-3 TaxID=3022697 RepID=UPI0023408890|nr:F0F1 ATP synthase subunit delta [Aneurinibacillus sp. Ricciae_BoGa-3]WCK54346.1 F0F1 ATP synthase subunit delta [Aneurinibacillus sp. Ricciae_BoGa-3]